MKTLLPPWPRHIPRVMRPLGTVRLHRPFTSRDYTDNLAIRAARGLRDGGPRQSGLTGTWSECFFSGPVRGDAYTAIASTASETSFFAGVNQQPVIPALFFDQTRGIGRTVVFTARGVFSNTSTPTMIFQLRFGTTAGATFLSGTSVGVTAAITTTSAVTNQQWDLRMEVQCATPGIGTGNCTLSGAGFVQSGGGFASPFWYALQPTTPPTATWTSTIDDSLTQYVNLSLTWGTSSSSNTAVMKQALMYGMN